MTIRSSLPRRLAAAGGIAVLGVASVWAPAVAQTGSLGVGAEMASGWGLLVGPGVSPLDEALPDVAGDLEDAGSVVDPADAPAAEGRAAADPGDPAPADPAPADPGGSGSGEESSASGASVSPGLPGPDDGPGAPGSRGDGPDPADNAPAAAALNGVLALTGSGGAGGDPLRRGIPLPPLPSSR